jgi:hypothetical protein
MITIRETATVTMLASHVAVLARYVAVLASGVGVFAGDDDAGDG